MTQYPTSPVQDGITNESIEIPRCIQLEDGKFYCYDHRGKLVSIQNVPDVSQLDTSKIATRPTAISTSRIVSATGTILLDSDIIFAFNDPYFSSNSGLFNNENILWQGWPSLSIYTGSPTPGVNGAYGSITTLFSNVNQSPRTMFVPLLLSITWRGTFAAGETVSVQISITVVYGTSTQNTLGTGSLTASATSPGTQNFGCAQIYTTIAPYLNPNYNYGPGGSYNSQYISQITASAASSAASTSVTVSVTLVGFHT